MFKHTILAMLMLAVVGTAHTQNTPPLKAGVYQAEDMAWTQWGEWTTKTENGRTYISSGTRESSLSITVKGMYVLIHRVPEFGGGEMYVRMNDCVELYMSQSAHDIGIGTLLDIEGETDLTLQLGAGRLGIDAIEVLSDTKKAERLIAESTIRNTPQNQRINFPFFDYSTYRGDIPAKDCVKKPPQPTAVPPTATPFGYIAPTPQPPAEKPVVGPSPLVMSVFVGVPAGLVFFGLVAWLLSSIDNLDPTKKKNG